MTRMTSAPQTVDNRWAITKLVRSRRSSTIACWTRTSVRVSTAELASSRMSSSGRARNVRAMVMSCFSPELTEVHSSSSLKVTGPDIKVGYARVSTSGQDLTAQRHALAAMGVAEERVYVDHGLTGTTRARPGLAQALAASRGGDTLVVTKLDRLARSLADARDIADELTAKGVALNLRGSVHDPTEPMGGLLFNVLGMVAEFESDLIRTRTKEGLAVARAAGKLRRRQPKLSQRQEAHLAEIHATGTKTPADLAHLFAIGRSIVYRALARAAEANRSGAAATGAS